MNVNFVSSGIQGKSMYFTNSNDGKNVLFKNSNKQVVILVNGAGDSSFDGTYTNVTGETYLDRPVYRNTVPALNHYLIRRGGGPDAWYMGIEQTSRYYNTTVNNPWDGSWLTVPFGPSPAPTVSLI